ncbi:MAG: elongation factor G [Oscillospiraceae bacterium]|nr:elongation factor G [Oscillospiraceae bacterium]
MSSNIRNLCLLGHGGDGKTSLAESILFLTKAIDRLGRVADGNTVCDFDPEETRRQISISAALVPVEKFNGHKLNIIDTPGYFDFAGEVAQALSVADTGVIAVTAKSGPGVGAEKAWKRLIRSKKSRFIYISKLDEENADFDRTLEALKAAFGTSVHAFTLPVVEGGKAVGVVDVPGGKAYTFEGGKPAEIPVPASLSGAAEEALAGLREAVAETSEELMEKFFADEPFTPEEMAAGIRQAVADGSLTPVYCGSAVTGVGTLTLLEGLVAYAPAPEDMAGPVKFDPAAAPLAFVFKTTSDQYGKFSFFKVMQGKAATDLQLTNLRTGGTEKLGHIYTVCGKKNTEVKEIACGDIGAVSKLSDTRTGDTLSADKTAAALPAIHFPPPCYALAFYPKVKGGEEKIASGLNRISEEDMTFVVKNNAEIKQMIVTAQGDIHLDVLCSRLKNKFGVEVETETPRVAYREKIRRKVTGIEGKHKKQSGGSGQFGVVIMNFEPSDTEDLVFEETVVGGSVPKQYFPAVEKGLRERIQRGVLAGYPVVFLKATLTDGKYHDVDSSEIAFKMAAGLAYKAGLPQASPVLLEPVGALKVFIPDDYMGDIIGDLNKRRGRVMGMNPAEDGGQTVEAEVPMAEMHSYAIDLRSMTQGRGSFEFEFIRYEDAPPNVQEKIIEERKAQLQEE